MKILLLLLFIQITLHNLCSNKALRVAHKITIEWIKPGAPEGFSSKYMKLYFVEPLNTTVFCHEVGHVIQYFMDKSCYYNIYGMLMDMNIVKSIFDNNDEIMATWLGKYYCKYFYVFKKNLFIKFF